MSFFTNRRQSDTETGEREEQSQLPRPAVPQQPIGFETVLGASGEMEGKLSSEGNVRLDGKFTGTLEITGNVLVGETAQINADIDARNISIAGAVRGNVAGNKVQILRTGRVWGDIHAKALTTEEGAFIDGRITMKGHEASTGAPAPGELPEAAAVGEMSAEEPTAGSTEGPDEGSDEGSIEEPSAEPDEAGSVYESPFMRAEESPADDDTEVNHDPDEHRDQL